MQLPLNNEIYFLLLSVREIKLVPVICILCMAMKVYMFGRSLSFVLIFIVTEDSQRLEICFHMICYKQNVLHAIKTTFLSCDIERWSGCSPQVLVEEHWVSVLASSACWWWL